jgi:hypothetical protein
MNKPLLDGFRNHSPFAIRHSLGFFQAFLDHRLQCRADKFGHEFRRRVVGARALPLRAEGQLEPEAIRYSPFAIRLNHRVVLEEALVHRTEFLDVERGVVHAAGRRGGRFAVVGEVPEGIEEVLIGDGVGIEGQRSEEFAVERRCAKQRRQPFVGEHLPQHPQAAPDVIMFGVGATAVEKAP